MVYIWYYIWQFYFILLMDFDQVFEWIGLNFVFSEEKKLFSFICMWVLVLFLFISERFFVSFRMWKNLKEMNVVEDLGFC